MANDGNDEDQGSLREVARVDLIEGLKKAGFEPEIAEIEKDFFSYTGFPKSTKKFALKFKSQNYSVEEMYFWMLGHLTTNLSFPYVHKITDVFASSTGSSMFGDMGTRLSALQNQASNLLASFGQMSKDLFKIVRDIRKLRERLAYYKAVDEDLSVDERRTKSAKGAENTLKDIWITMVEGGTENPSSVFGMATKIGFQILPDLFMNTPPLKEDEVKKYVDSMRPANGMQGKFNPTLLNALERKLYQFYHWKKLTCEELKFNEKTKKKLLYQHYQNMRLYLDWIRPYVKNAKRLAGDEGFMDSANIISITQSAMAEIEILLQKPTKKVSLNPRSKKLKNESVSYNQVIVLHFLFETTPDMNFHAKDSWQQKGPSHLGSVLANIRAYGWTDEEIINYKKMKVDDDVELIKIINYNLNDKDFMGDDLKKIIKEVEEEIGVRNKEIKESKNEEDDSEPKSALFYEKELKERKKRMDDMRRKARQQIEGPFDSLVNIFKDAVISPIINKSIEKEIEVYNAMKKDAAKGAAKGALKMAGLVYKNYKKSHKMITW